MSADLAHGGDLRHAPDVDIALGLGEGEVDMDEVVVAHPGGGAVEPLQVQVGEDLVEVAAAVMGGGAQRNQGLESPLGTGLLNRCPVLVEVPTDDDLRLR